MDKLDELIKKRAVVMGLSIDDALLAYIREEVVQTILNYINHRTLPEGLYYLVAKMVVSSAQMLVQPSNASTEGMTASSIKVGDTTVQLKKSTSNTTEIDARVSAVLNDYRNEINAFRKLRW